MPEFRTSAGFGNPIANALTIVFGVLAFVVAFSFGIVLLGIFLAVIAVLASIVSVRVWWFRRKLRGQFARSGAPAPPTSKGATIETEYEVLKDDPDQPPR